jgi:prophage DNA circulation protein
MSRNWPKDLWPASFKGVPFWIDRDTEEGGRRAAVHEFPHGDNAFIEDMGQRAKSFSVTAYLVGDTSDSDASTLSSTFDSDGAGTLVLPINGPITNCLCKEFVRTRTKDKMGFVAYEAKFWMNGSLVPLVTAPYLAQLTYNAIGTLATAAQGIAASLQLGS